MGLQDGLGPGDHLELWVDQISSLPQTSFDQKMANDALLDLVGRLKMRGITPVISQHQSRPDELSYNSIIGITTSHISLRARQSKDRLALSLDVFSCRNFYAQTVLEWLDELTSAPIERRAVLYNRHPEGTIKELLSIT